MQPADLFNPVVAYGAYNASMGVGKRIPWNPRGQRNPKILALVDVYYMKPQFLQSAPKNYSHKGDYVLV